MKRVPRLASVLVGVGAVTLLAGFAAGQTTAGAGGGGGGGLPSAVRLSDSPAGARAQIEAFVAARAAQLAGTNAADQSDAREALVREVAKQGSEVPTPGFVDLYTQVLGAKLAPLAGSGDVRVRLNAAIVVARVAGSDTVDNFRLADVTAQLLGDKSEAVVIWAMRAARGVVRAQASANALGGSKVLAAVPAAVGQLPTGPVTREAYLALQLDPDRLKDLPATAYPQVTPAVEAILDARIKRHLVTVPEDPDADRLAASYFAATKIFPTLTPAQRVGAVERLSQLAVLSGNAAAGAQGPKAAELLDFTRHNGRALQVIADTIDAANSTDQTRAFKDAAKALGSLPLATGGTQAKQLADALFGAAKGVPEFKGIRAPGTPTGG